MATTTTTTTTAAPAVTSFGLQILTPWSKIERVSRQMDPAIFRAIQGIWAKLNNDGTIVNIVEDTPAKINKMVLGSRTGDKYESHDTAHGAIATMESFGIRCKVSTNLYTGTISLGDRLVVSTDGATLGQLTSAETTAETGSYEVIGRVEEINTAEGYMIFRTISPEMVSL
jgi:hypothetical protein